MGFEPTEVLPSPVFKTGTINRSATFPNGGGYGTCTHRHPLLFGFSRTTPLWNPLDTINYTTLCQLKSSLFLEDTCVFLVEVEGIASLVQTFQPVETIHPHV